MMSRVSPNFEMIVAAGAYRPMQQTDRLELIRFASKFDGIREIVRGKRGAGYSVSAF